MKTKSQIKKISYRVASMAMAGAITAGMLFASGITAKADFETESLNNRASDDGDVVKQVASNDATTTLSLNIGNTKGITIKVYKIASVSYSSGAYQDPVWVEDITTWLKNQSAYSTDGTTVKTAFASPKSLASASSSTWNEFYNNLLYNTKSGSPLNIIDYGYDGNGTGKLTAVTTTTVDSDYANSYVDFDDLQIGMYAVMVTNTASAAKYNPIVVSLIPELNGPEGNYYLKEKVTADLKASEAAIDKQINGHDSDSVKINEVVTFTIDVTLPTLYSDRVTLSEKSSVSDYSLYVDDEMSNCFELYDSNGDGKTDSNDFTITYVENDVENDFPDTAIDYYAIADDTYDKSALTVSTDADTIADGTDYVAATDTTLTAYMYDLKTVSSLGDGSFYIIKENAAPYTIEEPSTKKNESNEDEPYYKINFNVGVLKQYAKSASSDMTGVIRITYKAKVNNKIEVNSENNKNTAKIIYEGGDASDIVRAYTYGLQVVKIDGTTKTETNTDYIAGAKFALYKETATFVKATGSSEYVWKANMDGTAQNNTGKTYAEIESDIKTNENSTYYLYSYDGTEGDVLPSGYTVVAGDKISRLFEKVTDGYIDASTAFSGNITSVATEAGVTVKGLDDGYYVLVETAAPAGYNDLSEDILFKIGQIDYETAQLSYNGSLAACLDLDDTEVPSGIISLNVLNYKGLTLPSTGGTGILMFTVLGMCIMMATMVVIIARQRKQSTDYYM